MSLAETLTLYFTLNILIVTVWSGLKLLFKKNLRFTFYSKLKWYYYLLFSIVTITALHPLIPKTQIFRPTAKIWTAKSLESFAHDYNSADSGGYLNFSLLNNHTTINGDHLYYVALIIFIPLFLVILYLLLSDLYRLNCIRKSSFHFFKYKSVRILINDDIQVPFSFMGLANAYVIIPSSLITNRDFFKISLYHEIQHHRQGDTRWIYFIWILKLICFFNPAIHLLSRDISKLQEFSCDEILIGQKKISEHSYANCLIAVAQSCLPNMKAPLCATGLTFLVEDNLLKRRIENMYAKKPQSLSLLCQSLIFSAFVLTSIGAAYASKGLVEDKRVSMKEARQLILKTHSEIPLEVNDLVLKQLNRYVGTSEGRDFFKKSLVRMEGYKRMIKEKIIFNKLPLELMAIPIVESGYQNLPQDPTHKSWGAGIWMFIETTARNYGLRVGHGVDERLEPELLTEAAIKYFQSNYALFNDWKLSILAYNIGEGSVLKAMGDLHTRDAWKINRDARENDQDYLARVMAAMIIVKNPDLLK